MGRSGWNDAFGALAPLPVRGGGVEFYWSLGLASREWQRHEAAVPAGLGLVGAAFHVSAGSAYVVGGLGLEGATDQLYDATPKLRRVAPSPHAVLLSTAAGNSRNRTL
jgi:hypothetical protein